MAKSRIQKLKEALAYLKTDEGIYLGDDIFLVGVELDGSDKCYGFYSNGEDLMVVTRGCSDGYPVEQMDAPDLRYLFDLSVPNIYKKILNKEYKTVPSDEI